MIGHGNRIKDLETLAAHQAKHSSDILNLIMMVQNQVNQQRNMIRNLEQEVTRLQALLTDEIPL